MSTRTAVHSSQRQLDKLAYAAHAACAPVRKTKRIGRTVKERLAIRPGLFAIPSERRYPIKDPYHAKLALAFLMRVAGRHGTAAPYRTEARQVLSAVKKHWPNVFRCEEELVSRIKKTYRI